MRTAPRFWPLRVAAAHPRLIAAVLAGLATGLLLPRTLSASTRAIVAWDVGVIVLLGFVTALCIRRNDESSIAATAKRQQEGEWAIFCVTLAGVVFSFAALTTEMAGVKDMQPFARAIHLGLVAATLLTSWLVTHVIFALRYAHEYYTSSSGAAQPIEGGTKVDGGLQFPGDDTPDYWDFIYFGIVLGMTFQVSDVQITSRKLRRLATVHGLIGFLFNTVIVALTVNIAASLMN